MRARRLQVLLKTETSTISLIDLAGSEKFDLKDKKVGAQINGGLLALGKVTPRLLTPAYPTHAPAAPPARRRKLPPVQPSSHQFANRSGAFSALSAVNSRAL